MTDWSKTSNIKVAASLFNNIPYPIIILLFRYSTRYKSVHKIYKTHVLFTNDAENATSPQTKMNFDAGGPGWTRTNVGALPGDLQSPAIATRRPTHIG